MAMKGGVQLEKCHGEDSTVHSNWWHGDTAEEEDKYVNHEGSGLDHWKEGDRKHGKRDRFWRAMHGFSLELHITWKAGHLRLVMLKAMTPSPVAYSRIYLAPQDL